MAFWDFFKNISTEEKDTLSKLHYEIEDLLSEKDENEKIKISCLAGLLARLSLVDFVVTDSEKKFMTESLMKYSHFDNHTASVITKIALENVKALGGIENHLYVHPLRYIMSETEKYDFLLTLFSLASSDGNVENLESEEIRIIAKGLDLSTEHFIAARASVKDSLGALK